VRALTRLLLVVLVASLVYLGLLIAGFRPTPFSLVPHRPVEGYRYCIGDIPIGAWMKYAYTHDTRIEFVEVFVVEKSLTSITCNITIRYRNGVIERDQQVWYVGDWKFINDTRIPMTEELVYSFNTTTGVSGTIIDATVESARITDAVIDENGFIAGTIKAGIARGGLYNGSTYWSASIDRGNITGFTDREAGEHKWIWGATVRNATVQGKFLYVIYRYERVKQEPLETDQFYPFAFIAGYLDPGDTIHHDSSTRIVAQTLEIRRLTYRRVNIFRAIDYFAGIYIVYKWDRTTGILLSVYYRTPQTLYRIDLVDTNLIVPNWRDPLTYVAFFHFWLLWIRKYILWIKPTMAALIIWTPRFFVVWAYDKSLRGGWGVALKRWLPLLCVLAIASVIAFFVQMLLISGIRFFGA